MFRNIIAFAQERPEITVTDVSTLIIKIKNLFNVLSGILFVVAAGLIIWAGFDYISSGADESKVKSAKNKFIYAIIAVVLIAIAQSIPRLVVNILGGQITQ